jgi:NAD-dependent dihydropyrimidine dehydrogenase PreA subunit
VIETIDMSLCNGCGICIRSCMSDVIRMDEKTNEPIIKYRDDCATCLVCQMDCPKKAINISPKIPVRQITSWGL